MLLFQIKERQKKPLSSLKIWGKFSSVIKCSYAQFSRYVPANIIKHHPEDWGTCLCMLCLNPELKLESVKREFPQIQPTIEDLAGEASKEDIKQMILLVSKSEHGLHYLEWSKEKQHLKDTKFDYCEMIFQEVLMDQAEQQRGKLIRV